MGYWGPHGTNPYERPIQQGHWGSAPHWVPIPSTDRQQICCLYGSLTKKQLLAWQDVLNDDAIKGNIIPPTSRDIYNKSSQECTLHSDSNAQMS